MRYVCPEDVKKMLLKQARTTYWKSRQQKHEYEELKEGIWLDPTLAMLRRRTKEEWTDKHRNVARMLVFEGWVQKRLFDIGCLPVEGFQGHVATDGSLLGIAGKWGACGWSAVHLDYDGELALKHATCGTTDAEIEVQRIIKRAELTAFLCLPKKIIGLPEHTYQGARWQQRKC